MCYEKTPRKRGFLLCDDFCQMKERAIYQCRMQSARHFIEQAARDVVPQCINEIR
jgi:hypothetical protein